MEHTLRFYRAIPDSELAVIPGASHLAPVEKPTLVNDIFLSFLAEEPIETLVPIRRRAANA